MSEIIVKLTDSRIKLNGGEYVRDLVRCKDCIYYSDGECKNGILPFSEYSDLHSVWLTPKPDDYCSYGERKEE